MKLNSIIMKPKKHSVTQRNLIFRDFLLMEIFHNPELKMVLHNKSSLKFDFALKMIILRQKSQNPQNFTKGAKF